MVAVVVGVAVVVVVGVGVVVVVAVVVVVVVAVVVVVVVAVAVAVGVAVGLMVWVKEARMIEPKDWKVGDVVRFDHPETERYSEELVVSAVVKTTHGTYATLGGDDCFNIGCPYANRFKFVRSAADQAQYSRLKLVMTPEAAKSFQKPRCADCGKQLQSDDNSRETAEGALCEECMEGRGGGVTCEKRYNCKECGKAQEHEGFCGRACSAAYKPVAPKIEQKPVCACCTQFTYPEDIGEEVRHEDPCIYSHSERWMLPKAKTMFRQRQFTIREQSRLLEQRANDLRELTAHELKYGANSARSYPDKYNLLTKGRCGT